MKDPGAAGLPAAGSSSRLAALPTLAVLVALAGLEGLLRLPPLPPAPAAFAGERSAQKAVERHADIRSDSLEIDLQLDRHGDFVLFHDETLDGRPIGSYAAGELTGKVESLEAFVAGLERDGLRLAYLHLDLKPRPVLPGRMARTFARARPLLDRLSKSCGSLVLSSPAPAAYADAHRFVVASGLAGRGVWPVLDLIDFDAADAARWRLPMTVLERAVLPAARAANNLYFRLLRGRLAYLTVTERTAASWTGPDRLICWSRETAPGPLPERCLKTERELR